MHGESCFFNVTSNQSNFTILCKTFLTTSPKSAHIQTAASSTTANKHYWLLKQILLSKSKSFLEYSKNRSTPDAMLNAGNSNIDEFSGNSKTIPTNFDNLWRKYVQPDGRMINPEVLIQKCIENITKQTADACRTFETHAFRYVFPALLFLAVIGSTLTLVVYRSQFLKNASTVLLLAVKALANLLGLICHSVEMAYNYTGTGGSFEEIYWYTRPYVLFLANFFGTLAVWCTLVITVETYMCMAYPVHFKRWARKRNVYVLLIILMLADGLHHAALPIVRTILVEPRCNNALKQYWMITRQRNFYYVYESVYFYVNCVAVIVVPNVLMLVFTAMIGCQLKGKTMGQNFSQRRRCVLGITISTTVCYLTLESPNLIVFFTAAVKGSDFGESRTYLCMVSVVTNFLAMLNAVVPFFVYVTFNATFRELLVVQTWWLFGIDTASSRQRVTDYSCAEPSRQTPNTPSRYQSFAERSCRRDSFV